MKYFIISSPRCGSHYCAESIAQRSQIGPLGECLNPMYSDDQYSFLDNCVSVSWSTPKDKHGVCSSVPQRQARLDSLLNTDNSWQAQAHLAHLRPLARDSIASIVERTHAILLYRENFTDAIVSWVIAYENDLFVSRMPSHHIQRAVHYNRDRHLGIIRDLVSDYKSLQLIKDKYNWFKVYKYEDFTGVPEVDFSDYTLQQQTTSWPLPIKNNTELEKQSLIINIQELIGDINGLV